MKGAKETLTTLSGRCSYHRGKHKKAGTPRQPKRSSRTTNLKANKSEITKQAVWQLGLIRKRSVTPANQKNQDRSKSKQLFDYLIVIDFESTCWNDGKSHYSQEIIEFPAVLLNTSTGEIESEFQSYVQPQEHPILSEFCIELTGIKQAQVDEGVPLKICLSQFWKWIQMIQLKKKIIFAPGISNPATSEVKSCSFVTWSDWDLGVCLEYECKRKQLRKPEILNSWIDLRATYKLFYMRKPKGLSGALQDLGLKFSGQEHSGLDDSRNTAHLAWRMIRDGCIMKITKSLNPVHPKKNSSCFAKALTVNQDKDTARFKNGVHTPSLDGGWVSNSLDDKEPTFGKNNIRSNGRVQKGITSSPKSLRDPPFSSIKMGKYDEVPSPLSFHINGLSAPSGKLQPANSSSPMIFQNRIKNGHLTSTPKYNSSALGSELVLVPTTVSTIGNISDMDISLSPDTLSVLANWEDIALMPDSQVIKSSDSGQTPDDSNQGTSSSLEKTSVVLKESAVANYKNFDNLGMTVNCETPQSVAYKSPHTTIYNVKKAKNQTLNGITFKVPKTKANDLSLLPNLSKSENQSHVCELSKRKPSSPQTFPPAKKQSFTLHDERVSSTDRPRTLRSCSNCKVSPSVLSSITNLQEPRKTTSDRMTPPLCNCGRRAKRLIVSNNGPNHGKAFYSCPVGKSKGNGKSCSYFKWENTLQKDRANSSILSLSTNRFSVSSPGTNLNSSGSLHFSPKKSLGLRPSMRT
ncbi:ERI1 exoribonuclease 2 [Tachyglossus aculeatus]|uniref:ERI1 exoribonuclease 2 n=1 Tax=Tachyglossus aculeatus TaxID=9261 RepID=UPI0018F2839F|nr:ERI1 exoribonuclease 2 [Tachyglossus aculeatus]